MTGQTDPGTGGVRIIGRDHGTVRVLHVSGAGDWRELTALAGEPPPDATALVVDLTELDTLPEDGVPALREAMAAVPDELRRVVVARGPVLSVLELAELGDGVELERNPDTVLTVFRLADEVRVLRDRLRQREQQLASLPVIEQAKGMLIQDFGLDEQSAFELLAALSQDSNTKLRDLARNVVDHLTANTSPEVQRTTLEVLADLRDRLR